MEPQDSGSENKPSKGYGKRSKTQWIVIYVVAAVIIYGIIYLLFIRKSGSSGGY